MQNHEIETEQGTVNYIEYGDINRPTIVCLHGLAGNGLYSFDELSGYLEDHFHLIVLDMPGHGRTSPLPNEEDYLYSNLAKWLQDVLNIITNKPFFIIGHSWGADAALHFTRHFPDNVQGLILLDGAFTFPQNQPEMTFDYAYSGWTGYMDKSVYRSENDFFSEYRSFTQNWDARRENYVRSIFEKRNDNQYELIASKHTVLSIIKAFYEEPFAEAYPYIKVPTILIHAEHPVELNEARNKGISQLKTAIEDVTVLSIPDSAHLLQWDHPNQLSTMIKKWISERF
ncbi:alpha/beta fold hydrolase [Planococcus halotolerans]|uniref:Alpha/beta hydrolase n=1 Tax=Planococcus halotolerans TaxID=2233542 RepID=A0A365KN86_9BACL|nr:alpha/beta hydrolase [Planococcus halotolerans]QHJ71849.1 alpha/beta fold hydrolase [Planococcus halotolerans]RAZ74609.1 alpha/beta hydrolase [Planococcus halotolerans]